MDSNQVLQEEMRYLRDDILRAYEPHRDTGNFERQLEISLTSKGFEILGVEYLPEVFDEVLTQERYDSIIQKVAEAKIEEARQEVLNKLKDIFK